MKKITFKRVFALSVLALALNASSTVAQTYTWTGGSSNFYSTTNWTSTEGPVLFDNAGFRVVHVNNTGTAPVIDQFVDWQPGIFDIYGGSLTLNADFQVFFNDWLNGTVTVNSGATFTCRNIIRVGRAGLGTVNVNGTLQANNDASTWQGIFIGVVSGGDGTVNVNNGGIVNGGYHIEVGTRDFYPTGVLNVNEGGLSEAYWITSAGPNGTINVNGGTVNTGQGLIVGDLYVDNAGNTGTLGEVVGRLNINSGTVTVNHNDLAAPHLGLHANAKVTIDNGTLRIMRTGVDFTADINAHVTAGRIVPAEGKEIVVDYDGTYTTVTAQPLASAALFSGEAFIAFPNPVIDVLSISAVDSFVDNIGVKIYDFLGKEILNTVTGLNGTINMGSFAAGVYMIKAQSGNTSSIIKVVKQ
jgi:hypothetical protein